jgi:H+/gluconate symporter-like permease
LPLATDFAICAFALFDKLLDDFVFFVTPAFLAFSVFLTDVEPEPCPAAAAAAFFAFEAAIPSFVFCAWSAFSLSSSALVGPSGSLFWRAVSTLGSRIGVAKEKEEKTVNGCCW